MREILLTALEHIVPETSAKEQEADDLKSFSSSEEEEDEYWSDFGDEDFSVEEGEEKQNLTTFFKL
jgi:hypothetical protein